MSQIKKLFEDAAIYGISSIFGRAVNFLLVPFYTSLFLDSEYGKVTELYAYMAFLIVIYIFGMETTFFRFSGKNKDTEYYFNHTQSIAIINSWTLSGLLILCSNYLSTFFGFEEASVFIRWLAIILVFDAMVAVPFARLRQQQQAKKFACLKIVNILINIGSNLVFYWPHWSDYLLHGTEPNYTEISIRYVFLSNLIASAFTFILLLPELKTFRFVFDLKYWKKIFKYAIPLVFIGFAGVTSEMLSRTLLRHRLPDGFYSGFTNFAILGIFGACYKLSMLMNLSVQAFRYAYEPFFFTNAGDKNSPKTFARVMNAFIIFGCLAFMLISIILPEIAPLLLRQPTYLKGLNVVPTLLFGGLLLGIFYNLSVWYKITNKTNYGAVIAIMGAILTVLLNWFLIPIWGYEGSATSTVSVYLIMVLISLIWGQKHYFVPYKVRGILYLILAGFSIAFVYFFEWSVFNRYLIGISAILIFLLLVFNLEKRSK